MAESISSSLAKRNTEESDTSLVGGGVGGVWQADQSQTEDDENGTIHALGQT